MPGGITILSLWVFETYYYTDILKFDECIIVIATSKKQTKIIHFASKKLHYAHIWQD